MNTKLLFALIQLAMKLPDLAADIKALAAHNGVSEQQWEDAAHILAQNPNSYFSDVFTPPEPTPPLPTAPYDQPQDGALPDDATLKSMGFQRGDWKWTSAADPQRWVVAHTGGTLGGDWQFQSSIQ